MTSELASAEQRKINVQAILQRSLGISVNLADITSLDRGYNNHLYAVKIPDTSTPTMARSGQPGTVPLSLSLNPALVVRLLKTELGALPERVQNEVAALALARQPLSPLVRVPDVYAWSEGRGTDEIPYIIMEFLPGTPLDTIWPSLDFAARLPILRQIADVLLALRSLQVPVPHGSTHYAFGGLAFSALGSITTTVHPNSIGGPFASAEGQWLSMLAVQLRSADENEFIQGWKASNLRTRLDSFLQSDEGFRAILRQIAIEPVFVHGDFNCRNFLVCPETHRLTALLDFEFARIGTSPEELMDGLEDFRHHTCVQPAPDGLELHLLESKGWPCQLSDKPAALGCETAQAWKTFFETPIKGYEATAKTYTFLEKLCPWYFCQKPWCDAHDMPAERRIAESSLSDLLAAWGF